jgi:dienelactone hydrolase
MNVFAHSTPKCVFSMVCWTASLAIFASSMADEPLTYPDHQDLSYYLDPNGGKQLIQTKTDWQRRRSHILAGLQQVMGPLPTREQLPPLDYKLLEQHQIGQVVRCKVSFVPENNDLIKAFLMYPSDAVLPTAVGKRAAILCLHQTTEIGKDEPAGLGGNPDLHYALELAERGFVTLTPDYPSFGEHPFDFGDPRFRYESGSMKGICDNIRAIDVLQSLPFVDPERIGCIGHSLGGHNAIFTANFEPRIKVIVSSCGFTRFHKYYEGNLKGWTSARYMPKMARDFASDPDRVPFDFPELIASLAPRPFFVSAPTGDENFEISGVKDCMQSARPIYQLFGEAENLIGIYPECGHSFPKSSRHDAYTFLEQHLGSP